MTPRPFFLFFLCFYFILFLFYLPSSHSGRVKVRKEGVAAEGFCEQYPTAPVRPQVQLTKPMVLLEKRNKTGSPFVHPTDLTGARIPTNQKHQINTQAQTHPAFPPCQPGSPSKQSAHSRFQDNRVCTHPPTAGVEEQHEFEDIIGTIGTTFRLSLCHRVWTEDSFFQRLFGLLTIHFRVVLVTAPGNARTV